MNTLHFHISRNNSGLSTKFVDEANIGDVLNEQEVYIEREEFFKIQRSLEKQGLTNLIELLEDCRENDNYELFESKTGIEVGEPCYFDSNNKMLISVEDVATGVGTLEFDRDYDTDYCVLLSEADEQDLTLISKSEYRFKDEILKTYFNEHTNLQVDWSKFDDDFESLIEDYFNSPSVKVENHYNY